MKGAHIVYQLSSDDGFYAQADSLATVWQQLLDGVQKSRLSHKMEPLYSSNTIQRIGLDHPAVRDLLEQLPNAESCREYCFQFRASRNTTMTTTSAEKGLGCVRADPFNGRKKGCDMFSWLASSNRLRPQLDASGFAELGRRVTNFELMPMTLRFRHLRMMNKHSVGVFKSDIHGRGLFSTRNIEVG